MRAILLLASGCNITAVIEQKSELGDSGDTADTADTSDPGSALPASLMDLVDLSVNDASADVDAEGLHLRTHSDVLRAGGFNGSGTGNKAIAGVPGYDGSALAELSGLAWESTIVAGSATPYLNLVIDLACDGSRLVIIVGDATTVTPGNGAGGSLRYAYAAGDPVWKAVGGLDDLLPSHVTSTGGTLDSVVAAYPAACLRDAQTGDGGMPAAEPTTAILFITGDSQTNNEAETLVNAVEVGGLRLE